MSYCIYRTHNVTIFICMTEALNIYHTAIRATRVKR